MSAHESFLYHYEVSVPQRINLDLTYGYNHKLDVGALVRVPLGKREVFGIILKAFGEEKAFENKNIRIKSIIDVYKEIPPFSKEYLLFLKWVSSYTLAPVGLLVKMAFGGKVPIDGEHRGKWVYGLSRDALARTPAQDKIKSSLKEGALLSISEIAENSGVSSATVRKFYDQGGLEKNFLPEHLTFSKSKKNADLKNITLSSEQLRAYQIISSSIDSSDPEVFLLEGVTGSGKTEVYFKSVADIIAKEGQALILLPEINLSQQWIEKFSDRFGFPPTVWHSALTKAMRRKAWRSIARGEAKVIVGARSALFLPYTNLKLIVVDEEHDPGYKQEASVFYQARDMAVVRGKFEGATVVLSTATPSLETLFNVKSLKYKHLIIKKRFGESVLPNISVLDMRKETLKKGEWISGALLKKAQEHLEKNGQILFYLNRRGFSPLVLCASCGHRFSCKYCDSWLVYHAKKNLLKCHQCGYQTPKLKICPNCHEEETLFLCGPGVERVAEELHQKFPNEKIEIASSDTLDTPSKIEKFFQKVESREVNVIVGTQIMAKGHHFPSLSFVGIIDGDVGLMGADIRSLERSFQLMHQVSGRAGRSKLKGEVIIQTHIPDHPMLAYLKAGDQEGFLQAELDLRETYGLPPFGGMASIIISGRNEKEVEAFSQKMAQARPNIKGVEVFGPSPALITRLKGNVRWRFLLKTKKRVWMQPVIKDWISSVNVPSSVNVQVDIDPYNFS